MATTADSTFGRGQKTLGGNVRTSSTLASACTNTDSAL